MIKLTDQINGIYSVVTRMGTTNSCHCTVPLMIFTHLAIILLEKKVKLKLAS